MKYSSKILFNKHIWVAFRLEKNECSNYIKTLKFIILNKELWNKINEFKDRIFAA
jgi:hypothetical protein